MTPNVMMLLRSGEQHDLLLAGEAHPARSHAFQPRRPPVSKEDFSILIGLVGIIITVVLGVAALSVAAT